MSNLKPQENLKVQNLKTSINGLINEYEEAHALLNDQMQAVIDNDISLLNELIEKQVATYESLQQSEAKFKTQLQTFHHASDDKKLSLHNVLKGLDKPCETLNRMRSRLHSQVQKTEHLRSQLMNLLQFAQQQNAEVFKAICTFASASMEGYDASGQQKHTGASGIAINQQA